jgi:MFS family permease
MESLWLNSAFLRLCLARTISALGSKVTATALPLTAAVTLQATPGQMAMLVIAGQLPDVIFGLLAGSWVDRGRHRQFLIGTDLGQALLLAIIPAAAILGVLNLQVLLAVAFLTGSLSLLSGIASVAVLPSVVRGDQLVDANAKLTAAGTVASLAGPGFAGALIQLLSAPKAILVDSISYIVSAFSLRGIGGKVVHPAAARSTMLSDIREGLRELIATPLLRALTLSSAIFAAGLAMQATVLMLFLTRSLHMGPTSIGIFLAASGLGAFGGSLIAGRVSQRVGVGYSIIGGTLIESIAAIAIPLSVAIPNPIPLLIAGQILNGVGISVYSINHISLRQSAVQPRLLGRITAGRRFVTFCIAPVGAIIGGWIGATYGLAPALSGAAFLFFAGTAIMWLSPVRRTFGAPAPAAWS